MTKIFIFGKRKTIEVKEIHDKAYIVKRQYLVDCFDFSKHCPVPQDAVIKSAILHLSLPINK